MRGIIYNAPHSVDAFLDMMNHAPTLSLCINLLQ